MLRAEIGVAKSGAGHQHHAADAGRRRRAAGFGHALDRKARDFRRARHGFEVGDLRQLRIEQIEIGKGLCKLAWIGEAGELVGRRHFRHRHRALGERSDAVAGNIVGRDHRLLLPDQHAQADIVAFRALGFLDRSFAHFDRLRHAAGGDGVGGVSAGAARGFDQPFGQFGQGGLVEE